MFEFSQRYCHGRQRTFLFSEFPNVALAFLTAVAVAYEVSSAHSSDAPIGLTNSAREVKVVEAKVVDAQVVEAKSLDVSPDNQAAAAGGGRVSVEDQQVVAAVPDPQMERDASAFAGEPLAETVNTSVELRASTVVRMAAVSRVTLRLLGFSDLNGGYAINAGTISIPGVGRFDVSEKTIGEFETALTSRLSEVFRRDIAVSVEVDRYAPYFVTGQVVNPGEIDWRPGLTLIQAIALAGGEQRSQAGATAEGLPTIQQARSHVVFNLAELERLKTEKDELKGLPRSDRPKSTVAGGNPQLDALAHRQDELLQERRTMMHTQLEGLRKEHESALTLLESSQTQAAAVERQLELSRSVLDGIGKLHSRKLVANSRYMEQQSDVAAMELRVAEIRGLVETARARVAATERQIAVFQQQRLAAINERIEVLEREIAVNESTIASFSSAPVTEPQAPPALEYNIARQANGVIETIPAHVFTEVMPGDVIIVSPRPSDPQRTSNVDRTRLGSVPEPMRETIARTERLINSSAANRISIFSQLQQMTVRPVERR